MNTGGRHHFGKVKRQNRTLLKALKVAEVERKNCWKELQKFLLAYRLIPQATTGATTALLMFVGGGELWTKFPEQKGEKNLDKNTRDLDWKNKLQHKSYADDRRGATSSPILPGDKILLNNTKVYQESYHQISSVSLI